MRATAKHVKQFCLPRFVHSHKPAGFTLVEMLVVLALTLIMMTLFANIFTITGNFVSRQKGIAENDQSARTLTTALQTDLQNRTMHYLAPFHPNMPPLGDDDNYRQGYFYYSENNPLDDTDDVLQFTVKVPLVNSLTNLPNQLIYGRSLFLPQQAWQSGAAYAVGSYVQPTTANANGFIYVATVAGTSGGGEPTWPVLIGNTVADGGVTWQCVDASLQPDGDDGALYFINAGGNLSPISPQPNFVAPNSTGASQYAEVSFFLRHGNLYRRVLLLRGGNYSAGASSIAPQPGSASGQPIINGAYAGNFWTDFDYSARYGPLPSTPPASGPCFFDSSDLTNLTGVALPPSTFPIGRPDNRFGHDQTDGTGTVGATWPTVGQTGNGAPREYDASTPAVFFGRYTHEETSYAPSGVPPAQWFGFPGYIPTIGGVTISPMAQAATVTVDPNFGYIQQFSGGSRRGEEILLTNVFSFDVKILDAHYSEIAGSDVNRNGTIESGPAPAFADLGHTAATGDFQQASNIYPLYGPHAATAPNTYTSNGVTYNYNNVFDTWFRQFDFDNADGDGDHTTGCDPAPNRPRVGNLWQPNTTYFVGALVDPGNTANGGNTTNGYVYKCITGGQSGAAEPFQLTDQVSPPNTVTDGGTGLTWQPQPPLPVQAIQITVKYLDPTQNLLRQVTFVQSLTP